VFVTLTQSEHGKDRPLFIKEMGIRFSPRTRSEPRRDFRHRDADVIAVNILHHGQAEGRHDQYAQSVVTRVAYLMLGACGFDKAHALLHRVPHLSLRAHWFI